MLAHTPWVRAHTLFSSLDLVVITNGAAPPVVKREHILNILVMMGKHTVTHSQQVLSPLLREVFSPSLGSLDFVVSTHGTHGVAKRWWADLGALIWLQRRFTHPRILYVATVALV